MLIHPDREGWGGRGGRGVPLSSLASVRSLHQTTSAAPRSNGEAQEPYSPDASVHTAAQPARSRQGQTTVANQRGGVAAPGSAHITPASY